MLDRALHVLRHVIGLDPLLDVHVAERCELSAHLELSWQTAALLRVEQPTAAASALAILQAVADCWR